ncbi:MAG: TetR/AcrR family transcriptional regulator [Rhodanobacter sp.]
MKTTPYHHGALREALLMAAEAIIRREGLPALTLRAAAREAGVSHAAPSHHFGDLPGLLTELAAAGFARFAAQLREINTSPHRRRWDGARAYVAFAEANPALFQLMFRSDRLDPSRPSYVAARAEAYALLAKARGVFTDTPTVEELGNIIGGWSLIHGFSMLLLDGRLEPVLAVAPEGTSMDDLFEAVLASTDRKSFGPSG